MKKTRILLIVMVSIFAVPIALSHIGTYINDYGMSKIYDKLPPEDWTKTPQGRYAHSLKYEDKLAPIVPFDIKPRAWYLSNSIREKRSQEYFEHLCNTEAGNYVWQVASPTNSVALLRPFELPIYKIKEDKGSRIINTGHYLSTNKLESPINFNHFMAGHNPNDNSDNQHRYLLKYEYRDFVSWYGSSYNDYQVWFSNGDIIKYTYDNNKYEKTRYKDRKLEKITSITADYGITWRGFSRPHDREYGIAGGDLIIVNLKTNEVMAVQRNFAKAWQNGNKISWYNTLGCFELYKNDVKDLPKFDDRDSFQQKLKKLNFRLYEYSVITPFLYKVLPGNSPFEYNSGVRGNEWYKNIPLKNKN